MSETSGPSEDIKTTDTSANKGETAQPTSNETNKADTQAAPQTQVTTDTNQTNNTPPAGDKDDKTSDAPPPSTGNDNNKTTTALPAGDKENKTTINQSQGSDNKASDAPSTAIDKSKTNIAPPAGDREDKTSNSPSPGIEINKTTIAPPDGDKENKTNNNATSPGKDNKTSDAPSTSGKEDKTSNAPPIAIDKSKTNIAPPGGSEKAQLEIEIPKVSIPPPTVKKPPAAIERNKPKLPPKKPEKGAKKAPVPVPAAAAPVTAPVPVIPPAEPIKTVPPASTNATNATATVEVSTPVDVVAPVGTGKPQDRIEQLLQRITTISVQLKDVTAGALKELGDIPAYNPPPNEPTSSKETGKDLSKDPDDGTGTVTTDPVANDPVMDSDPTTVAIASPPSPTGDEIFRSPPLKNNPSRAQKLSRCLKELAEKMEKENYSGLKSRLEPDKAVSANGDSTLGFISYLQGEIELLRRLADQLEDLLYFNSVQINLIMDQILAIINDPQRVPEEDRYRQIKQLVGGTPTKLSGLKMFRTLSRLVSNVRGGWPALKTIKKYLQQCREASNKLSSEQVEFGLTLVEKVELMLAEISSFQLQLRSLMWTFEMRVNNNKEEINKKECADKEIGKDNKVAEKN